MIGKESGNMWGKFEIKIKLPVAETILQSSSREKTGRAVSGL
jgi:hypothetical protein